MDQREPTAANGIEAEFDSLSDDADSTVIEQSSVESAPNEAEGGLFDRYEVNGCIEHCSGAGTSQ